MRTISFPKLKAIILTLVIFNGCATGKVWDSYNIVKKEKLKATSDQLYYSCIDTNCDQQKFLLPYKLNQTGISLQKAHPSFEQGYIIINNKECISSISDGLKIIVNNPSLLKNCSIKANITKTIKPDGSHEHYIDLYIIAKRIEPQIKLEKIASNQSVLQYEITNYSRFDEDGSVIPKNSTFFTFGNKECKNRKGCIVTKIHFMDELKFTSANENWLPIQDANKLKTISIVFINEQEEKIYRKSLTARIVLTPFSIAADIITAPIVLLTFPLWHPK